MYLESFGKLEIYLKGVFYFSDTEVWTEKSLTEHNYLCLQVLLDLE
jgi:hypothetical protein